MFCSLSFLLPIIWRKEQKLFVNPFIKLREVAHVSEEGLRSLVLQRRGMDRQMHGWMDAGSCRMALVQLLRNLHPPNPCLPAYQRAAGSLPGRKVNLECDLKNDSVLKLLFLKGYFQLGSSPQHAAARQEALALLQQSVAEGGGEMPARELGALRGGLPPRKQLVGMGPSPVSCPILHLAGGCFNLPALVDMTKVTLLAFPRGSPSSREGAGTCSWKWGWWAKF